MNDLTQSKDPTTADPGKGESRHSPRALERNVLSDICVTMSDMAPDRITIRVPETLGERLRNRSRMKGLTESELVREALETYLGLATEARPAYELAEEAGLIGCVRRAPKDLSTSPRHFEGFGKLGPEKIR